MANRGAAAAELLSFLIADIRGYTTFTQARGDEAAAELADKFARVAREGIEAHGGRLMELRGDEALAVFTSARASLRAAVALQEVFADETRLEPGLPLTVGIGLDAGEVVPVQGGYRGGALNLAARLCSLAKAGEALASEGVTHLARAVEGITVTEWGTAEVKGLAEPLRAFTVATSDGTGLVPAFVTLSVLPGKLDSAVPIVGRDAELRQLSWAWRQARRGRGAVVVVRGPSGIGKTRLLSAVAEVAVRAGGAARFFSQAASEPDPDGLRKALTAEASPVLVAVDDVDAGAEAVVAVLVEAGPLEGRPVLVVLAVDEEHATDQDLRAVRSLNAALDIGLSPLDTESVRAVAALYLGSIDSVAELPAGLLESTGGVPRRLHQTVASWAEDRATRRLGVLATQAAGSRSEVAVVESQLAGTVSDLQAVRERTRLYGLGPGRHVGVPEESPYKGLDSFGPKDAEAFFGRERLVADLVARVAGGGLVGVVGPSGSGKSSLVRAGLIPAVTAGVLPGSQDWLTVVLRPGEHPIQALNVALLPVLPAEAAAALTGTDPLLVQLSQNPDAPHVLVVVDQAEELFTVCTDEHERGQFVDGLVAAAADPAGRIDVVLTVRADYYGRFAGDQRLASAIAANQVLVGPMTAEEYRRAITRPAQRHGVTVEPELVDALVDEVTGQPGALPLLSTALVELWEARTDRTMTLASYQATGGLQAAVARLAESVYASLDPDQQAPARRMFLRLTGPGAGDTVVKRRVRLTDLALDEPSSALVDLLARRRLLTVGDGAVEVAHEALLREWPRFTTWLEEDREGVRLRAHLTDAATAWETEGRDEGELYRGARLSATLDWTTAHAQDLNPVEQEFVTASSTEHQRASAHQHRQNRRLRGLLAGAAVLLVAALVAGLLAVRQGEQAQKNAAAAKQAATTAQAQRAGARAAVTDDVDLALLLGVAGVRLEDSPETVSSLMGVLAKNAALVRSTPLAGEQVLALDVSADGRTVATIDLEHHVRILDLVTGEERADRQLGGARIENDGFYFLQFSPDAKILAVGNTALSRRSVVLLDAADLQPLAEQPGVVGNGPWQVADLTFSRDGGSVAAVLNRVVRQGDVRVVTANVGVVWEVAAPSDPTQVDLTNDLGWAAVALSPDGELLYSMPRLRVYDLSTGQNRSFTSVAFADVDFGVIEISPDGSTLVMGTGGKEVLVNARTGRLLHTLVREEELEMARFSADGSRLLTWTFNGDTAVWDVGSGKQLAQVELSARLATAVDLDPQGKTVISGGRDNALREFDMEGGQRYLQRIPVSGLPLTTGEWQPFRAVGACFATPSPEGRFVNYTICRSQHTYAILDLTTASARPEQKASPGYWIGGGSWSQENFIVANGGTIEVWNGRTGQLERKVHPFGDYVVEVDHSPDGSRVVMAELSGRVTMLDGDTLESVGRSVDLGEPVQSVSAGPDGHTAFVLVGGPELTGFWYQPTTRWALVDLERGTVVDEGDLGLAGAWAAYSPDGSYAAVSGLDGDVVVIDLRTGQAVRPPVRAHEGFVPYAAFSPDGSQLVTAGLGSVALWDTVTGVPLARITIPTPIPTLASAEFLADGHSVLIVPWGGDSAAYVWDPTSKRAVEFACRAAGRDLTEEEWRDNFGDEPYRPTCPASEARAAGLSEP